MKKTLMLHIPKTGGTTLDYVLRDSFYNKNSVTNLQPTSAIGDFIKMNDDSNLYVTGHIPFGAIKQEKFENKITIIRNPIDTLISIISFAKKINQADELNKLIQNKEKYPLYSPYFSSGFEFDRFITEKNYGLQISSYINHFDNCSAENLLKNLKNFNYILDFSKLDLEIKRLIIAEGLFPYSDIPNKRNYKYTPDKETAREILSRFDIEFYEKVQSLFVPIPEDIDLQYENYKKEYCSKSGIDLKLYESMTLNLSGPVGVGWHNAEKNENGVPFRWSESKQSTVEIPFSDAGDYTVHIYIKNPNNYLIKTSAKSLISTDQILITEDSIHDIRSFKFRIRIQSPDLVLINFETIIDESLQNEQLSSFIGDKRTLYFVIGEVIIRRIDDECTEKLKINTDDENNYKNKLQQELAIFEKQTNVHDLPQIFHYWSSKHLGPILNNAEIESVSQFFSSNMLNAKNRTASSPAYFISIGSGNCDLEVSIVKDLLDAGFSDFIVECLELNPTMLERGKEIAREYGVLDKMKFVEVDFNTWVASKRYDAIIANQALHHVTHLEHLYDQIKIALHPLGSFIISDTIGRNGHQRWPEALNIVNIYWKELSNKYKFNVLLNRLEDEYENWDCSKEGFEGIRAQEVLPLLVERFECEKFIGFGNVIDIFIDRCFGHNFNHENEWDKDFIDRIHAEDEKGFLDGSLTPTHMMAVFVKTLNCNPFYSRGIDPHRSIRNVSN